MPAELDAIDMKILELMQRDASLSTAELAERVGLSQSPCWRRIQRMREEGYIYAIIGGVGPQAFYEKCVGAHLIPDSTPGIYKDFLGALEKQRQA